MQDNKDFKEGLKGTTLFGGVGVFNILITIVKSKVVAVLLGPSGMGLLGLFNSSLDLIGRCTNFSLRTSAVKELSSLFGKNDESGLAFSYSVFKKLIIITGCLGLFACIVLSPYLSYSQFGDYSYTVSFIILAASLPIMQLFDGLNVLMQSTRHLKMLAKSNIVGNFCALLAVIPLYYFWGLPSVVYTLVLGYLVHFLVAWYYTHSLKIKKISVSLITALKAGKDMIKMGFFISLQGIFSALSAYVVRAYISNKSGVDDVGLYTAGFYIISSYTGIIFSSMSTEYYPRLAAVASDEKRLNTAINCEMELSITLLAPLICIFILFGNLAIMILYSKEFLSISAMVNISMLGMFFRAPSWCLGYVYLAKGDSKIYFWNELAAILYFLVFNVVSYNIWGITGLGISFLLSYLFYWIQQIIVCRLKYQYVFNLGYLKIAIPQFVLACICYYLSGVEYSYIKYILGVPLLILSIWLAYKVLNSNVNIEEIISRLKRK